MPWFAVDDGFWGHPKRLACGAPAIGLWVTAGSWSAQQLTDGFVPKHALPALGGKPRDAAQLVEAGLWLAVDGGWRFHDFHAYNPTAEEVRAKQAEAHEAKVRAGRAGGLASGIARRKHSGKQTRSSDEAGREAEGQQNEAPSRPVPSRPEGTDGSSESLPLRTAMHAKTRAEEHPAAEVRAARKRAGLPVDAAWSDRSCERAVFAVKGTVPDQHTAWAALAVVAALPDTTAPGRLEHKLDDALADLHRSRIAAQTARHDARVLQELHEAKARASTDQASRAAEARALLAARSAS